MKKNKNKFKDLKALVTIKMTSTPYYSLFIKT